VVLLQQEAEICEQGSGLISHIKAHSMRKMDNKSLNPTPGSWHDRVESFSFFGGLFSRVSKRVMALGYNDGRAGMRLGYQMYSSTRMRANGSAYFWVDWLVMILAFLI